MDYFYGVVKSLSEQAVDATELYEENRRAHFETMKVSLIEEIKKIVLDAAAIGSFTAYYVPTSELLGNKKNYYITEDEISLLLAMTRDYIVSQNLKCNLYDDNIQIYWEKKKEIEKEINDDVNDDSDVNDDVDD